MNNNKSIINKLTALWALNESGLGGFLHVFKTPFTGIIVGGIAILLISLIAYYAENKWQTILKSLLIVLIIKMAVSPYSPFGAYVAVSFQALFAALLFTKFSWKGMTLMVLGMVTFLESAIQKLLILTIIYGTGFWDAINIYGASVQRKLNVVLETSSTSVLVTTYLILYSVCGILAGFFIKSMITIISNKKQEDFYLETKDIYSKNTTPKRSFKFKIIWIWLVTVTLIVFAFTFFGGDLFGWKEGIYIVLRSFLILMIWYLILGPFLLKLVQRFLNKKESQYKDDISNALDLFPYFRQIISFTWNDTKHLKGYSRFKLKTFYGQ